VSRVRRILPTPETIPWRPLFAGLLAAGLLLGLFLPSRETAAGAGPAPARLYVEPFLFPPYPGTASEEAIFDHSSPNYSQTDSRIVAFTGDQGDKLCPSPAPAGSPPPQTGVCDGGSGLYWSYSFGDWLSYNGHDGIDYGMQYRPVYAAAESTQVISAGWSDPMDHRYSLGLSVRLQHANGYTTTYGHLSAIAVQACDGPGCIDLAHGTQIGYSGNTGNSAGPHLHFKVADPSGKSVDPYGWTGEFADPWPYNQVNTLWVNLPSVVPFYGSPRSVLPAGDPLALPAAVTNPLLVDDASAGFSASPASCWTVAATASGQAVNGSMRYVRPVISAPATCTARWAFPTGQPAGSYAVYVHLPGVHNTSEGALYTIAHAGRLDTLVVNQATFPNPYYVADGWLYIGAFDFSASGSQYVSLSNLTQDTAASYLTRELGADAIRFVRQFAPTPTLTASVTQTPTPSQTPSRTLTPTNTPTASATPSYTPSATSSLTRTPTASHTPTVSRTPSRTLSSTPGASPTRSRTPTRSGTYTRTTTSSRTPTRTRTSTPSRTPTRTPSASRTLTFTPTRTPTRTPTASRTFTFTRTLTRTPTVSRTTDLTPGGNLTSTRWPSSTPRSTDTRWPTRGPSPTSTVATNIVQVYFTNRINLALGIQPYETQVTRLLPAPPASLPDAVLVQYFLGPTGIERLLGLDAVLSGFTGYTRLRIEDSVAHVYLAGTCNTGGEIYTIADALRINLLQFDEIKWVKFYDQNGQTQYPAGQIDSIPGCLEP